MTEELLSAYKSVIQSLDSRIRLLEEDIEKLKKIRKDLERFLPVFKYR